MIKLTYGQIRSQEFLDATTRIHQAKMSYRSAVRLKEVFRLINKELDQAKKDFLKLTKKHMDERDDGNFTLKDGDEHRAAYKEFLDTVVEINAPKLTDQEMFHVELSPREIEVLDGLIGAD